MNEKIFYRPTWRKMEDGSWHCLAVMAVVGIVNPLNGQWLYTARVMHSCALNGDSLRGIAVTLEGAKRIVETVLEETNTLQEKENE